MTDDLAVGSVRQADRSLRWLTLILVLAGVVHGVRVLAPFFIRGDLLYHWGLTNTILLGSFPPDGPYAGLPAYYPPGFHVLLAAISTVLRIDPPQATALLGILWLPVIPLGAFVLTRRLTGRPGVALLATVLTAFAGGLDLSPDRLWVNSMFMAGQAFYPIYPRDLVFGILPFAMLAFLRGTDGDHPTMRWAVIAGGLLGICGLIQVQLLLPIPLTLAIYVFVVAIRHPGRARRAIAALVVTGIATIVIVGPWLGYIAATIESNGGVSIDSSDNLLPARIGFWNYPIQFGLVLPLAVVGAGLVLLFLRRGDGPRLADAAGRWSPKPVEGGLILLTWWIVPVALAVLYQPWWPLEDALRPQRMWLVSGQPALILAAMGLMLVAEWLVARRPERPRLLVPLLVVALLVACVPTTLGTERLLWTLWRDARYADLQLGPDHVPEMSDLLTVKPPRPTILTYEDWSSLVWYETGAAVVAVEPPGFAKLAFDPAIFTGHSQADRRTDLAAALRGDTTALTAVADDYDANRIVLGRRGSAVGVISQPATLAAARPGATTGATSTLLGNGWDATVLTPGSSLAFGLERPSETIDIELRVLTLLGAADDDSSGSATTSGPAPTSGPAFGTPKRLRILAGNRPVADLSVPFTGSGDFQVVRATVVLQPGEDLIVQAGDPIAIQSMTGFVADPGPPSGWAVARTTADAVVWERTP